jgi:hypothetical protein
MTKRILSIALALVLGLGPLGQVAAQTPGTLAGTAEDEANQPYSNYEIRAFNVDTSQIATTGMLNSDASFSLGGLNVPGNYMIELYDVNRKDVVCREGPFQLTTTTTTLLTVDVDCGNKVPLILLLAGLGAGAAIATVAATNGDGDDSNDVESGSQ